MGLGNVDVNGDVYCNPWRGNSGFHSLGAGLLQALIQLAVPLFPIAGSNFDWFARVQGSEGESFEILFPRLVRVNQALDVRRDGKPLCFGSFANALLHDWVNRDGHWAASRFLS